jgi:hypothetical protein
VLGITATWSEDTSGASSISISDVHGLLKPAVMLPEELLTAPTQDRPLMGHGRVVALKVDTVPPHPIELPKAIGASRRQAKIRGRETEDTAARMRSEAGIHRVVFAVHLVILCAWY